MAASTTRQPGKASVFIDGEAGTTGLEIRERLAGVSAVDVKSIDPAQRKDREARAEMMRAVDLVVLCLPDAAAREAVAIADELQGDAPKIIDASTAHRVAPGWVYGFAELTPDQPDAIKSANRVANPGCYPTGAIALLRPLVESGVIPSDYPVTVNAVSGYSGGGRGMIEGSGPACHRGADGGPPARQIRSRQIRHPGGLGQPGQVRLEQARSTVAHQQRLEDAVAAHGGQIVGVKQRCRRVVQFTVERDDNTGLARHGQVA